MSQKALVLVLASFVVAASATPSQAQPMIGDATPDLSDLVLWLKGDPVPRFEPGFVYLIDFWATWCPPCYPMIDQLSDLERRFSEKGLIVVGITVGTDVGVPLHRFLARESHRIEYRIAQPVDEQTLKARLVHESLMDPSNFGLPFVMLVDRQGRLAWVSDPYGASPGRHDELGATVEAILDDTFDLDASIAGSRNALQQSQAAKALLEQAQSLRDEGQLLAATRAMIKASSEHPREAADEAVDLFQELLCRGHTDLASSYGRQLLETALSNRVTELVQVERSILALGDPDRRDLQLAMEIARHNLTLQGGDHPDFLFEMAKVLTARNDSDAESFRSRAVKAASEQGWQDSYIGYLASVDLESALHQQAASLANVCGGYAGSPA